MDWNFGDVLDALEPLLPQDEPAFIHGPRIITHGQAQAMTNNLARALVARGSQPGDKIAIYMRNRPEYLLALAAAFKARMTHVNVNYRYTPDEVWYIFDNSDAQTVVYAPEFRDAVAQIRPRLPKVKTWIEISGNDPAAPFAERFDDLAVDGNGGPLDMARSGEDQFFIYTGGTTGMPKGVMWTHNDLQTLMLRGLEQLGLPVPQSVDAFARLSATMRASMRMIPAPPLMHGTGLLSALRAMLAGGSVVTLTKDTFDAEELLDAIDRHKPQHIAIVGDSFARPILNALNANPGKYDVSSVMAMNSSGVMWSLEVKRGLLQHMPNAMLSDAFSSSEALGLGTSVMTKDAEVHTAKFVLGDRCKVFDESDNEVLPGSGIPGMVAIKGPNPLGYYKDDAKTARTFRTIGGERYSIPGDWVTVEADGSLTLLGRGNACINTAGEKVFPEEVEEALKRHPAIEDALVVGMPDEKWGQAVTGVVSLTPGAAWNEDGLRAFVRGSLAGYKTPKRIVIADRPIRAANGKADYPAARASAEAQL
jgi:fatty-acyl-CoA synthase